MGRHGSPRAHTLEKLRHGLQEAFESPPTPCEAIFDPKRTKTDKNDSKTDKYQKSVFFFVWGLRWDRSVFLGRRALHNRTLPCE